MENDLVPELYISYAWEKQEDGSNWPIILQNLYSLLTAKGYKVHIDIKSLKYKDNIKTFMRELGRGKYIITIISEKYMKSLNCMYEVLQMLKYPSYQDRIFPILSADAKIYDSSKILEYLIYWDEKIIKLNNEAKALSNIAYAAPIFEDIETMNDIRRALAQFGDDIGNMNVLTPESHNNSNFKEIIDSIDKKFEIDKNTIDLKTENLALKKENIELKIEIESLKLKLLKSQEYQIKEDELILNSIELVNEKIETEEKSEFIIQDFESFLGFTRDSFLDDCVKVLGSPILRENEEKYNFNGTLFNDELSVSYYKSSKRIMVLELESMKENVDATIQRFKSKGITDSKINFLGKHKNEIIKLFGEPDLVESDNYLYQGDKFQVNFICYEFNDYLCNSINVHFFRNE